VHQVRALGADQRTEVAVAGRDAELVAERRQPAPVDVGRGDDRGGTDAPERPGVRGGDVPGSGDRDPDRFGADC